MSLFSDVDWTILLVAGALLLMGDRGKDVFRTLGRMYGKFLRLRQELMLQVQTAVNEPERSAAQGPLPVIQASSVVKEAPVAPPSPVAAPPVASPVPLAPAVAASTPSADGNREVHTGSAFPPEGAEMYR